MKTLTNIIHAAFALFAFACFALSGTVKAVSPPPDGGYPGGNTAEGFNALFHLSAQDGGFNTAVGFYSLFSNVTGSFNTALGAGALDLNTGHNNTATGAAALLLNTTGSGNTAVGTAALIFNNAADGNTAVGGAALFSNVTGPGNTAVGAQALFSNTGDDSDPTNGRLNTAVGLDALYSNTTGNGNTAVGAGLAAPMGDADGVAPLGSNTTGNGNTAVGGTDGENRAALGSNTTGSFNTAVGAGRRGIGGALGSNTTGRKNTAVGVGALAANAIGENNTAIGSDALTNLAPPVTSPTPCVSPSPGCSPSATPSIQGNNNVAVGVDAGSGVATANNVVCIGASVAGADVDNTTYIGNINTTAQPIVMGVDGVTVDLTTGKLGHGVSSRRFKEQIKPMDEASTALYALKPVTFHYKKAIDPTQTLDFGLIAEEVAAVNPELAVRDREGKISDYRHDAVNAMLLNEFLKEHRKVEQLEKQVEKLTAGLQRVSAQLELSKSAPQTVLNSQ